ncbi:MAG: choice-of-anchor Q domain-containing protein [Kofleriaceae bacterium]
MTKFLFASLIAVTACQNPKYCAKQNPDNNCDEPGDGGNGSDGSGSNVTDCTTDSTVCTIAKPVCDTDSKTCVECEVAMDCKSATAPVCDATDHTCGGCVAHSDCASGTCMPDGSCADDAQVAWVDAGFGGSPDANCSKATPCKTISPALDATSKSIVHIKAGSYTTEAITINDKTKTIVGDRDNTGALTSVWGAPAGGIPLSIGGTTTKLSVKDVAFVGSTVDIVSMLTTGADELHLLGSSIVGTSAVGLDVTGGAVTIERTQVANCLGGGISMSKSSLKMTNAIVSGNSGGTSTGGVFLSLTNATIDFSTIADNTAGGTATKGVNNSTANTCTITNSDLSNNTGAQATGCTVATSNTYPDAFTGNMNVVPMLTATYHLDPSSPLVDMASTTATVPVDIDGNKRPMGANRDIGADEAN